jgi:enoyl-CoA hydratase/carnithine racemase
MAARGNPGGKVSTFSSRLLKYEVKVRVGVLTLDRPEKRNAVNEELIGEINRFFQAPPKDVGAIVLAGAGDHFCAGLDLSEHKERDVASAYQHSRFWHRTFDLMQFGPLPLIAAMQGAVIGGGLELASVAHVRVAEPDVIYQLPEGRRGIFVGGGASVRVARIIGAGRMTEMMLTGRKLDAADGQALGLSHYLVGKGEALGKALELGQEIAGNAPLANLMMLHAIPRIADMSMTDGLFTESVAGALTQTSEDARAGMQAFLEKRGIRFDK